MRAAKKGEQAKKVCETEFDPEPTWPEFVQFDGKS
jgi:hypothetical protein